jgi:hypothetical protein
MAVGRSIGYQYDLPQGLPQDQLGGRAIRGGLGAGQPMTPQGGVPVPEGLQWVDDQTGKIYQKWGELNQFAKTMKTQYGMDVTNPDYTDPQQVQISQAYQKGIADLYMNIDKFKSSQRMMEEFHKRGGQFVEGFDPTAQPLVEKIGQFERRGILPEATIILEDFQKAFSDPNTAIAASQHLAEYKKELQDRLATTTNPVDRSQLRDTISVIKQAEYDATDDLNRAQRARALKVKLMDRDAQIEDYWDVVGRVQKGETQLLGTHTDTKSGKPIFKEISGVSPNGDVTYQTIDFITQDPETGDFTPHYGEEVTTNVYSEAGQRTIAEQLNKYGGYDELLFAYAKTHPARQAHRTVVGQPKLTPPMERGEELQEQETSVTNISSYFSAPEGKEKNRAKSVIVGEMDRLAKAGKLVLPAGVPLRGKTFFDVDKATAKEGESVGGETIVEVVEPKAMLGLWDKGGIDLITKEGKKYFLPYSSDAQQGFGEYSKAIEDVLRRNQITIPSLLGYGAAEAKETPEGVQVEQAEVSTIVVDGQEAITRPDGKIKVKNEKGQVGWVTQEEFQRTGSFTIYK